MVIRSCTSSRTSSSTIAAAETIGSLLERGHQPPVLTSANVPGGREADETLRQQYAGRIR